MELLFLMNVKLHLPNPQTLNSLIDFFKHTLAPLQSPKHHPTRLGVEAAGRERKRLGNPASGVGEQLGKCAWPWLQLFRLGEEPPPLGTAYIFPPAVGVIEPVHPIGLEGRRHPRAPLEPGATEWGIRLQQRTRGNPTRQPSWR